MIVIIKSEFNKEIVDGLLEGCKRALTEQEIKIISVPGAFELPAAARKYATSKKYQAVITLGCVIKGQTPHFQFISDAVTKSIINISVEYKKPIGNGIITCLNKKQAYLRVKKGSEASKAVKSVLSQKN